MKQKRRIKRIIEVSTLEMADKIKEQCLKEFITYDLTDLYVYEDNIVTAGSVWIVFWCLKDEWSKIKNFYNLKKISRGVLDPLYKIRIKIES